MEPDDLSALTEDELWTRLGTEQGLERALLLLELGERALAARDFGRAGALFEGAASAGAADGDTRLAAHATRQLGLAGFMADEYDDAARAYRRSAEQWRDLGEPLEEAWSLWGCADALRAAGDFEGALRAASACLALAQSEGYSPTAGEACFMQARALYWLDREREALTACAAARGHFRSAGLIERVTKVDDFALTVSLYLEDLDEALELASACLVLARNSTKEGDLAYALRRVAEVHLRRGAYDLAIDRADEAAAVYRRSGSTRSLGYCEGIRGRALRRSGREQEALEALLQAKILFEANGADRDALFCLPDIAMLQQHLDMFAEAARTNRQFIEGALGDAEGERYTSDACWAAVRLAENYRCLGQLQQASAVLCSWLEDWPVDDEDTRLPRVYAMTMYAMALNTSGESGESGDSELALQVARQAIADTRAEDAFWATAYAYEIDASSRRASGDPLAFKQTAHAVALHLAHGSTQRAAELSEFLLPDSAAPGSVAADDEEFDRTPHRTRERFDRASSTGGADSPLVSAPTLADHPAEATASMALVQVLDSAGQPVGDPLAVASGRTIHVGRSSDNELSVTDPQVSRRHLAVTVGSATVLVRDLNSTNGTYIEGARIPADVELEVSPESVIALGSSGEEPCPVRLRIRCADVTTGMRGHRQA